jgi:hypothetical protein
MRRFQEAWAALDFDGIVALLADDALLTMPPEDMRFHGPAQIRRFFATAPLERRLDSFRVVPRAPTASRRSPPTPTRAERASTTRTA